MSKDEKFPNTDIHDIGYNLKPNRNHEKADFQSATIEDEKFPNIDTLATKHNLEPKRNHEKADFQSAATKTRSSPTSTFSPADTNPNQRGWTRKQMLEPKTRSSPNIGTLATEHKPKKTNKLDHNQYEQAGDQSPGNIQERLVCDDDLVDRSQSRTNVRILGRNERNGVNL